MDLLVKAEAAKKEHDEAAKIAADKNDELEEHRAKIWDIIGEPKRWNPLSKFKGLKLDEMNNPFMFALVVAAGVGFLFAPIITIVLTVVMFMLIYLNR